MFWWTLSSTFSKSGEQFAVASPTTNSGGTRPPCPAWFTPLRGNVPLCRNDFVRVLTAATRKVKIKCHNNMLLRVLAKLCNNDIFSIASKNGVSESYSLWCRSVTLNIVFGCHFHQMCSLHSFRFYTICVLILCCVVLINTGWSSGWWVGECFFWYRLTRVVPDKGP